MADKSKIEPRTLKGFRDFLPEEQIAREKMVEIIRKSYELFGFSPIETPTLEYSDILTGKYGDEGDKLMYRFKDNGERDVAMRYDLTIPLARVTAQYGDIKKPFKRYQIANVFRADNPQKGRYREFCQCDADIVGSGSLSEDVEILVLASFVLKKLGVSNFVIKINDRRIISEFYEKLGLKENEQLIAIRAVDKMDKIGRSGVEKELKEKGIDEQKIEEIISFVEFSTNDLGKMTATRWFATALKPIIEKAISYDKEIPWKIDFSVARGLDYYTGMIFEVQLLDAPQYGSVLSGGRYNGLVGTFANKTIPAVGMSVGVDRLFAALQELKLVPEIKTVTQVLVANLEESLQTKYAEIANALRDAGINTEVLYEVSKSDKNFKYADDRGIPFMISDVKGDTFTLKNLKTGDRQETTLEKAINLIKSTND